jgi:hypothetical protein
MGARLVVAIGLVFGGFVFVSNMLLLVDNLSRGRPFMGAVVAALFGGLIGALCIWAVVLEHTGETRDPFGRARFEEDRRAAEKAGLK